MECKDAVQSVEDIETLSGEEQPLPFARTGRDLRVVRITAGRGMATHLSDLCLGVGSVVRLLRVARRGPVLIAVGGSRYALGRGVALKVWVVENGA